MNEQQVVKTRIDQYVEPGSRVAVYVQGEDGYASREIVGTVRASRKSRPEGWYTVEIEEQA